MQVFNKYDSKTFALISFISLCFLLCLQLLTGPSAFAEFEKPGILQASSFLPDELRKGANYSVGEEIKNDGLINHYTVKSTFGTFQVSTTSSLRILVQEIKAIAAMRKVETDDTAVEALKASGKNTVTGLKNLFSEPEETFENAAAGVRGLFNRAKETVGKREITGAEDSRVEQLIGLSKSKGLIATKYGVNMYSRNTVLQGELDRLATADYLGGLGMGVATSFIPGVGGLILTTSGTARLLNEAINTTPASELWLQNKKKLLSMGMDQDIITLFLNNPEFSPAMQTIMVSSLESLGDVANRELFIKVSLQASDPEMAKIITETAILTAGYHKNIRPIKRIEPLARLTNAVTVDGSIIILIPTDYVIWSSRVADVTKDLIATSSKKGLKRFEIWTPGKFSPAAAEQLKILQWELHPSAQSKLLPISPK